MIMWFQKEIPTPILESKNGFFSKDWESNKKFTQKNLKRALDKTFQKGTESLKCINGDDKSATVAQYAMDETYNDLTLAKIQNMNYGVMSNVQLEYFAGQGFIGWQTSAMLSQNWLIDKACTMTAKDAIRHGYEITVNDGQEIKPEILNYIKKQDKLFKVTPNCVELVRMGRIFGIRIAMFKVKSSDKKYYEKPFNIDGIKPDSYLGISQIDPYWVAPLLDYQASSDPSAMDFYEPTWWTIQGKKVHRSHLVIFRTNVLPDILKPSYIYGGVPIPQKIAERVFAAERTASEAPALAMSKRLTVYRTDLDQAIANVEDFSAKMEIWTNFMNNFGVKIVGGDDEIQQFDTSLADLDEVIMTQYQLVAAASNVPATKLLGTSPKGFNATGEFEEASYHEELESIQQHDLAALIDRHHAILMRSHVRPKFGVMFETEVRFKPVDSPTAAELAEINLKKAQTDNTLVQTGGIDGSDVRDRLIQDKDSGYNGMEPIDDPLEDIDSEDNDSNAEDGLNSGEQSGGGRGGVKESEVRSG